MFLSARLRICFPYVKLDSQKKKEVFLFYQASTPGRGPPSLQYNGYQASSPDVKRSEYLANHSRPLSVTVRMGGFIPPLRRTLSFVQKGSLT